MEQNKLLTTKENNLLCNFYGSNYNRNIYTDSGTFHGLFTLQFFFVLLAGIY